MMASVLNCFQDFFILEDEKVPDNEFVAMELING